MKEEFGFESIKNKALEQLKSGEFLLGKDGALFLCWKVSLMQPWKEMDAHLTEEERDLGNLRNGKMQKQDQTLLGECTISAPQDRQSTFEQQFTKKNRNDSG